jgi:hypothetical protein
MILIRKEENSMCISFQKNPRKPRVDANDGSNEKFLLATIAPIEP